jgi:hypothetical protein
MANWCGTSRSNYFRVKDAEAFKKWAYAARLGYFQQHGVFCITGELTDDGYWPSQKTVENEDGSEDEVDFDVVEELPEHLAEGEVAVLMSSGAMKLQAVTGEATAVTWDGRTIAMSLNDIYEQAATEFGVPENSITKAEY